MRNINFDTLAALPEAEFESKRKVILEEFIDSLTSGKAEIYALQEQIDIQRLRSGIKPEEYFTYIEKLPAFARSGELLKHRMSESNNLQLKTLA